jgi:hypothetical protein
MRWRAEKAAIQLKDVFVAMGARCPLSQHDFGWVGFVTAAPAPMLVSANVAHTACCAIGDHVRCQATQDG